MIHRTEYSAGVRYANASSLTELNYAGMPASATAVDFSGDGRLDLVVTGSEAFHRAISWDEATGVPAFADETQYANLDQNTILAIASSSGVAAADYNNDGNLDLYLPRQSGHLLLRNHGGSVFSNQSSLIYNTIPSLHGAWGDYDADGFVDLVVVPASTTEEGSVSLVLLHNNGGTSFSADGPKGITGGHTRLRSVLWGDLNRDQRLDLVAVQTGPYLPYYRDEPPQPEGTYSRYWLQQSDGSFQLQGLGRDDNILQYRSCQAILMDAEPDGDLDLAYTNVAGAGHFANGWDPAVSLSAAPLDSARAIFYDIDCIPHGGCPEGVYRNMIDMDLCDFNLDGKPDYVAVDPDMHPYATLAVHADGQLPKYTSTIVERHDWYTNQRNSGGVAVADFGENGRQGIFVARNVGTSDFFFNPEPVPGGGFGNWIGVKLRSYDPGCNRYAVGATVVVSQAGGSAPYVQAQVVDGGSGRAGQSPLNLVFGLGTRTGTVDVSVYWPDGQTVQTYTGLPIGQYHELQLGIDRASTTFTRTFDPGSGLYTWEFQWYTDAATPAVDDLVVVTPDSGQQNCSPSPFTLDASSPAVTVNVTPIAGRYRHNLAWHGVECTAPCRFTFVVASRFDNVAWSLVNARVFRTDYCIAAP